jgi:hypothetical protein
MYTFGRFAMSESSVNSLHGHRSQDVASWLRVCTSCMIHIYVYAYIFKCLCMYAYNEFVSCRLKDNYHDRASEFLA